MNASVLDHQEIEAEIIKGVDLRVVQANQLQLVNYNSRAVSGGKPNNADL
jgi:hypothetical protein